jgi:hypothetical protein
MRTLTRFYGIGLLGAALLLPAFAQEHRAEERREEQRREDARRYRDVKHKDEHEWNNREDQAYRMWAQKNHRKYNDFSRLKSRDQQSYWDWRHNHSDSQLKIEIR